MGIGRDAQGNEIYTDGASAGLTSAQAQALIDTSLANRPTTTAMSSAITAATAALPIPNPAQSAPPGVSDSGAQGNVQRYAMENHTHASKARKQRVLGVNTATYTWTYPTPFGAGVIPICNAIIEDPANVATDSYNIEIVGAPSNTQCTFRIIRQSTGLLALLTGALSLNPTPGTINLHCLALEP